MIPVTKPFLPDRRVYEQYVSEIWERNWLTNDGPLVKELENRLKEYLGVSQLLFLSNGTIAIQIAIKALELHGEIITTPFSYVATSSSIVWEGCTPVFADIDPHTLNIDPNRVESLITPRTSALIATHVYGNPCDIDGLNSIAYRYGLKVIYDGAHAFGTRFKGRSIYEYGDVTTASFHATKLFHTVEGGAVFTRDNNLLRKMAFMRNFGHNGPGKFAEVGINGKNSEFHAAMGLANLPYADQILKRRKEASLYYDTRLSGLDHYRPTVLSNEEYNYSYYAIIMPSEHDVVAAELALNKENIYPRRYFYPSLDELPYVTRADIPVARSMASRVLCLPLFDGITMDELERVARVLLKPREK